MQLPQKCALAVIRAYVNGEIALGKVVEHPSELPGVVATNRLFRCLIT